MKYYFVLVEDVKNRNVVGSHMSEDNLIELKKICNSDKRIIREYEIPEVLYNAIEESPFLGNKDVKKNGLVKLHKLINSDNTIFFSITKNLQEEIKLLETILYKNITIVNSEYVPDLVIELYETKFEEFKRSVGFLI